MRIPFGTGGYRLGESAEFSAQRMVNAYVEPAPPGSEVPAYVRQRYGIDDLSTVGNGPIRGGGEVRDVLYVVSGTKAYRVNREGVATELGSIPGSGYVTIKGDETHVVFLAVSMYVWNGTTLAAVADADAPSTQWLDVLDGYYIGSNSGTEQFYISANRDPTSWDALDFASAEKYPDDVVTGIVDHGELILFGKTSGEVFYNSGAADFPFEKVPSGHFEVGCRAVRGPAKLDNTVFFPGHDGVVYRLNGYVPERISTHAIETRIQQSADQDFEGRAWTEAGHKFYALKCSEFTLVYDVATQLWHECETYGQDYWKVAFVADCYGRTYVGQEGANKLGILTGDVPTDFGVTVIAKGTCQIISDDNKRLRLSRLELVFESGVGSLTETNPMVMLRWSDNRGRTWSNEHWRALGGQGQYRRAVWGRQGASRSRTYEWSISANVRRTLIAATIEAEADGY